MYYLLDGYNIITISKKMDIDSERDKLITFVRNSKKLFKHTVIIFFDGSSPFTSNISSSKNCKVVFTWEKSADDAIIDFIIKHKNPKEIIVVTNDRELQNKSKANGCRIETNEQFYFRITSPPKKIKPKGHSDKKIPSNAQKITEELARLWLKKTK
jgi:predicted RNA-binding protein with PIN domain